MSWNDRNKDSESNVNSLFKRRSPRYRSRGIFNFFNTWGIFDVWLEKLLPVTVLDAPVVIA